MEDSLQIAYAEVCKILEYIPRQDFYKIPSSVRKMLQRRKSRGYQVVFDPNKPLEKQNLQRKTLILLSTFHLYYWCEEETKEKLLNFYWQNGKRKQEELRKKYNTEDIFQRDKRADTKNISVSMVVCQESKLQKLWNKLRQLFRKA